MLLTHAALVGLALRCVVPAEAAPLLVRIIEGPENRARETHIIGPLNSNGTRDYGLGQVNSGNFGMLSRLLGRPINEQTILDPCTNLAAAGAILVARYNGSQGMPEVGSKYVRAVIGGHSSPDFPQAPSQAGQSTGENVFVWRIAQADITTDVQLEPVEPDEKQQSAPPRAAAKPPAPPAWDVWASEVYRRQNADDDKPEEAK
jgi:hypothetical protein